MKQELNHNTGARFSKVPVIYRALNAVLFKPFQTFQTPIIQDGDLKSFENYEMKVSAKEAKRTSQGPSTCFSIL